MEKSIASRSAEISMNQRCRGTLLTSRHGTSQIIAAFVVDNCNDEGKTQCEKELYSHMNTASGVDSSRGHSFTNSLVPSMAVMG
jgi:hypothetical protein